ncbi:MAG TPA: hypothetical protein VHU44_14395 [Acidobacteriaceae bacterium]|nr:hypothetical protein [Acidobacteriaceae bacterium]
MKLTAAVAMFAMLGLLTVAQSDSTGPPKMMAKDADGTCGEDTCG